MPPKKKVKVDIKQTKDEVNKKEQEESESEESEDESTDDEDRGRGKRNRRESKGFEPFDFTMASEIKAEKLRKAGVPKGRGVKLGSIALVKEAIEKTSGDDLVFAYTFVFGHRGGKMTRKEMKEKLLEFSGYYPPVRKGKTEAELDREEELQDKKYAKAFKMPLSQVKKLTHFFRVEDKGDDGKPLNKDDTVEALLEFLSEPDQGLCADPTAEKEKKKEKPQKKRPARSKKPVAKKEPPADPFAALKAHEKGKPPGDKVLRQWVKAYVVCFDMDSATTKHAITTASERFGVNLAPQKAKIKEMLAEEF